MTTEKTKTKKQPKDSPHSDAAVAEHLSTPTRPEHLAKVTSAINPGEVPAFEPVQGQKIRSMPVDLLHPGIGR